MDPLPPKNPLMPGEFGRGFDIASRPPIIMVIGPLRSDNPWQLWANVQAAANAAEKLWNHDFWVICPHTMNFMPSLIAMESHDTFINFNLHLIAHVVDGLYVLDATELPKEPSPHLHLGPKITASEGSIAELSKAHDCNVPIFASMETIIQWKKSFSPKLPSPPLDNEKIMAMLKTLQKAFEPTGKSSP